MVFGTIWSWFWGNVFPVLVGLAIFFGATGGCSVKTGFEYAFLPSCARADKPAADENHPAEPAQLPTKDDEKPAPATGERK